MVVSMGGPGQIPQSSGTFNEAFGTCDVDTIVGCVTDDFTWAYNGEQAGEGKSAFEERMRAGLATGRAEVVIDQLVEQGDTIVALNRGRLIPNEGDPAPLVAADAYTFIGDKISRMQTYGPLG